MRANMDQLTEIADGIYQLRFTLEQARSQSRVYLVAGERGAVVETGPTIMVPSIVEALKEAPGGLDGVAFIVLTHLHLDHGGGIGALSQALPRATVVAHERGIRHLADPSRLIESTRMAFGRRFEEHYGPILPVAPERAHPAVDGEVLDLGVRKLEVVHTPGHAPHHLCLMDSRTRAVFVGEALGHFLPDTGLLVPSIPLPMVDLKAIFRSINRIQRLNPDMLIFSQFGHSPDTERLILEAKRAMAATSRIVLSRLRGGGSEQEAAALVLAHYDERASHIDPQVPPMRFSGAWAGTTLQLVQSLRAYFRKRDLL